MMRAFHSVFHLFKIATLALFVCLWGQCTGMDAQPETPALTDARARLINVGSDQWYWEEKGQNINFYTRLPTKTVDGELLTLILNLHKQLPHVQNKWPNKI